MRKIGILIPVRNEERFVKAVITSLFQQTYPIEKVVVVDDGSSDQTVPNIKELRRRKYSQIKIIQRPDRGYSAVSRPEIAETFNIVFKWITNNLDLDFILVIGGDSILPFKYVESLVKKFYENKSLVLASGVPRY